MICDAVSVVVALVSEKFMEIEERDWNMIVEHIDWIG